MQTDETGFSRVPQLCDVCQTLDLSKTSNREPCKYSLGPWKEIHRKATSNPFCPFCKLLLSFIGKGNSMQISIEWKKKGGFFFDTQGDNLAFLNEGFAESPYGSARTVQPTIDPSMITKWLQLCETHHKEKCTPRTGVIQLSEGEPGIKTLRLIDTREGCIVDAKPGDRYLALSYVWGESAAPIRLTKDNLPQLSTKGAFNSLRNKIPKTIQHAIDLVQLIKERYLWVDSLCLVQDNDDDMLDGIAHMDLVYQGAICTIIAAHGGNYNAGLPGLHPGSRVVRQNVIEVLPGISMTQTTGVYNSMRGAHVRRGWTLQELVLSHRTIVFTGTRIYFRCRTNSWSEDTIYDNFPAATNEVLHSGGGIDFMDDNESRPLVSYVSQLFRYGDRTLSHESDTIHAFTGILRFLSTQSRSGVLEGLLTSSFDICLLCWDVFPLTTERPSRRKGFPSWSWAGWRGLRDGYGRRCGNPDSANSWLRTQTYIVWYKRGFKDNNPSLVWSVELRNQYGQSEDHHIGYRSNSNDPYGRDNSNFASDLPTYPTYSDSNRQAVITQELEKRKYHFLQFFAYTIRVHGFGEPPQSSAWAKVHPLWGPEKQNIGGIKFDNHRLPRMEQNTHELILLSKMDLYDNFFNDKITIERPFYWVMLIVWIGKEKVLAERRGIGFIFQDSVEHVLPPGMVWKEIVLA